MHVERGQTRTVQIGSLADLCLVIVRRKIWCRLAIRGRPIRALRIARCRQLDFPANRIYCYGLDWPRVVRVAVQDPAQRGHKGHEQYDWASIREGGYAIISLRSKHTQPDSQAVTGAVLGQSMSVMISSTYVLPNSASGLLHPRRVHSLRPSESSAPLPQVR